ncbi:MAG: ATP-binding protein [Longimicrobiales bacterium]
MGLRTRLFLTFGGIALLVLAPALFAVSRLAEVRNIAFAQRGRHAAAKEAIGSIETSIAELDRLLRSYVIDPDDALRRQIDSTLIRAGEQLQQLRESSYDAQSAEAQLELARLDSAAKRIEAYVEDGQLVLATAYFERVKPVLTNAQEALRPVDLAIDRRSLGEVVRAQQISEAAYSATLLVAAISLILALLFAAWTTRVLTRPLIELRAHMAGVAGGDFEVPPGLPYERDDEIGDLSRSFRSMAQQLAELDRLKAEFVSFASHELKTPINVIGGYADLMTEGLYGPISDEQRDVLQRLQEQTVSLAQQVSQLLDISRIEAGGFRVQPTEVSLEDVMGGLRRTFEPLAEQKRIRFSAELDDSAPRVINADADRLRNELLGNLISNAFKFTPEGGRIRVRAAKSDSSLRIDVSDTGAGIPADELPFIFEKFYQVGPEARAKGSGLGLAIARQVTEAHGGAISAESQLGRGTTFHIDLPLAPDRADA